MKMHRSMLRLSAVIAACMPFLAYAYTPAGVMQEIVVQDRNGVACFGIEDTREARRKPPLIGGASVSQPGQRSQHLWYLSYIKLGEPKREMAPGECLLYGDNGTQPAPPLVPGGRYIVEMWGSAQAKKGFGEPRTYTGAFCIVRHGGILQAKQIYSENGSPRWQDCHGSAVP